MMRCIAIDDEPLALFQITKYIEKTPFIELVQDFSSALDAIEFLSKEKVDLIFVDINMPDLSGMDFVKSLQNSPHNKSLVIFTTAYSEYALEGFKVNALDYLLKPFGYDDFLKSAQKALEQYNLINKPEIGRNVQQEYLFIKADYKMIKVYIRDIDYIEGRSEYIRIYRKTEKSLMTLFSMKSIEAILPSDSFMRIHRSYIINLQEIKAASKGKVILNNGVEIPIGEQYKQAFNSFLEKYSL